MRNSEIGVFKHKILLLFLLLSFICFNCVVCYASEGSEIGNTADEGGQTSNSTNSETNTEMKPIVVRVIETPLIDTSISAVATLLSSVAIFLSFMAYKQTRKLAEETVNLQIQHNHEEVQPILCIHFRDDDYCGIDIVNHGRGPAYITSATWKKTDSDLSENTLYDLCRKQWAQITQSYNYYSKPFLNNINDPDVLAPLEKISFLEASKNDLNLNDTIALYGSLNNVEVTIEYTDAYRSKTWIIKKDCTWFYNNLKDEMAKKDLNLDNLLSRKMD